MATATATATPTPAAACLTLRRVRLATLLRKASFGRLHIIWLNGSSTTSSSQRRHNNNDNMQQKRCLFCTDPQKVQLRLRGSGVEGGEKEQGKNVVGVVFILRCVQICSLLQHCCMGMDRAPRETAVPFARVRSHSFIHSLTSTQLSILIECQRIEREIPLDLSISMGTTLDLWPVFWWHLCNFNCTHNFYS